MNVQCWRLVALLSLAFSESDTVRVKGTWNLVTGRVQIISKFGFQQTQKLDPKNSRGFIFGNITNGGNNDTSKDLVLFVIVPGTEIDNFRSDSKYGVSCGTMMKNLSTKGFESRCFTDGQRGDLFRWVPCPIGKLCRDEDNPKIVLPGYQLTMQIQEPTTAEYWYVALVGCYLDENCTWQPVETKIEVQYDLWITNGYPLAPYTNPFTLQFSFDEQDSTQMYLITVLLYIIVIGVLQRARTVKKNQKLPQRLRMLGWIVGLKTTGVALQCINMITFSIDGEGILMARLFGEVFRMAATNLLCLLLIMLARGWCFSFYTHALNSISITIWATLCVSHIILFFCNFIFVYDIMHDVDIFTSWPGYGMLFIRIIFAMWFLLEVRVLIRREENEEKAVFLAHFGAGFLVWFVYLPGLGMVASFISVLWRFKIILGITTFANFCAICCLLHLFYPTSTNRKFFAGDLNNHRRVGRTDSTELEDFERLLYEHSESETDFPPSDISNRQLHDI